MSLSQDAKNAVKIGTLCSVAYLAVYIARNILSAVTPLMTAEGFSKEYIGYVSSLFLVFYACGQLINGFFFDEPLKLAPQTKPSNQPLKLNPQVRPSKSRPSKSLITQKFRKYPL